MAETAENNDVAISQLGNFMSGRNNSFATPVVEQSSNEQTTQTETTETQAVVETTQTPATTETQSQEQKAQEAQTTPQTKNFDDEISERTGGKFKSYSELQEHLSKLEADPFGGDEFARKVVEWKNKGGKDIEEFARIQKLDTTKMSDVDAIRMKTKLENPDLNERQIDLLVSEAFPTKPENFDDLADDEKRVFELAEIKAIKEGKEARKFLEDLKVKEQVPQAERERLDTETKRTELMKQHQDSIKSILKDYNSSKYSVNGQEFELKFDQAQKSVVEGLKKVANVAANPFEMLNLMMPSWMDDKGNVSNEKMVDFFTKAYLFDQFVKHAYDNGKSSEANELIKEIQPTNDKPTPVTSVKVDQQKGVDQLKAFFQNKF